MAASSGSFLASYEDGEPFDSPAPGACPPAGALVEQELSRIATQYREAWKFRRLIHAYLTQTETAARLACAIPDYFDLDDAGGDQLTIIGKWLGFPRCHCVCDTAPVFGFDCGDGAFQVAGFCEPGSTWLGCAPLGSGEVCIDDDEIYRRFLRARRYQMLGLYDIASLQAAAALIWGETASVIDGDNGRVVMAPGRALTALETSLVPVAFRVLPVAPGIKALVHLGAGPVFGFGGGWGGFCDGSRWLCATDPHAYSCAA